jgi:hypothetical protein
MTSAAMWAAHKLSTQIRIKQTDSSLLFFYFNGKDLQVNAYLFSTDVISTVEYNSSTPPPFTPQYAGSTSYVGDPFTWIHKISILQPESHCTNSLMYPMASNWLVKAGNTDLSANDMVLSAETSENFEITLDKLTVDGATCVTVLVNEVRYSDPLGVISDYVFSSA